MDESAGELEAEYTTLLESDVKALIASRGVSTTAWSEAGSEQEALRGAEQIGYPVALKVLSHKILHKTEIGGVALALSDESELRRAYRAIMTNARPIDASSRVIVQEMVEPGFEAIVGVNHDAHFGHVLMVGTGGVLTELLDDAAFGMIPVEPAHAARMVQRLRGYRLLRGYRGQADKDVDALVAVLVAVSRLVEEMPDLVELDLNPVIVHEHGAVVVDARARMLKRRSAA
jgi:acyl-CoA synthetase (NDP forming)